MNRLAREVLVKIFRTTVYSTAALAFCAWIVQSSRYLGILNTSGISLSKFLKFTSYLSVDIVAVIFPIALAVSAAFVYQRFIESQQLVALQSAGISPMKMLSPLLVLIGLMVCYLYANNAYISPLAWKKFRAQEFKIKNNINPPESAGSIFSSNGFSVYAQEYIGDLYFRDIFIVDVRNPEKTYTYYARRGTIRNNILLLIKGERIEIELKTHRDSIMQFQSYNCDLKEVLSVGNRPSQPNEKFICDLLLESANDPETMMQRALFHQKMLSPLLAFIFSLLAFFMILQSPYRRKPTIFRMGCLVVTIVLFQGVFFWIANASAKNPELIILNYVLVGSSFLAITTLVIQKRKSIE
ncbi:MAG: LptF/LptG family permease [Holosporaceae bacterium]|nr:LptF/LptG family permease [Holosporaceae bacterium]